MAYQAKRNTHYVETLELVDENGNVVHALTVDIDPGTMLENLNKNYVDLLHVQKEVNEIDTEDTDTLMHAYTKLGTAVIKMLEAVFGDEETAIILEFYHERYNDVITEVFPFINMVVAEVRKIAQENRRDALKRYNRKQRRLLKKRPK